MLEIKKKLKESQPKPNKKPLALTTKLKLGFYGAAFFLAVVSAYLIYKTQVVDERLRQMQALSEQQVDLAVKRIENFLNAQIKELEFFSSKPMLAVAMVTEDTEQLEKFRAEIKRTISPHIDVRLFSAGTAELNDKIYPPIRFPELELIRFAEKRKLVIPEAALLDGNWVLTRVVPVPLDPNQESVGTILLTVELTELHKRLVADMVDRGSITVKQQFGAEPAKTILAIGAGGTKVKASKSLLGSHWHVEFNASKNLEAQTHINLVKILSLAAGLSLLYLILAAIASSFMMKRLHKSSEQKLKDAVDVAAGKKVTADPGSQYANSQDILDVAISEEDEALLGLGENEQAEVGSAAAPVSEEEPEELDLNIPAHVFRAYDIRGLAKTEISNDFAQKIGQALGSEALDSGENTLIVARDARLHSPELTERLIRGILSTGCHVLNIGTVPTPLMYFATETLEETQSGVMVTASHNGPEYNGFKIVMNGECRSEADIRAIRGRIQHRKFHIGVGQEHRHDIIPSYVDTIFSDVALASDVSIVVDAGNGVGGIVAPRLFEELGCLTHPLYCELDGAFPNHSPDPSVEANLKDLIAKVQEVRADIGIALDGDGDRLVVVTPSGQILWPDRLLMLFAKDIVSRNPGADVVFDVKSSRQLNTCITSYGGRPVIWKTGHSPMKEKMRETGALVGAEYSGHFFIKDRWYGFDDGMYAAARLLEIISLQGEGLDEIFEEFPNLPSTPEIRIAVSEEGKFDMVERLVEEGEFGNAKINRLDGLRVDFPKGWGLVRASNTSANLTLRFEAEDEESLQKIMVLVAQQLRKINPKLDFSWLKKS